jgi:hypothetical protein
LAAVLWRAARGGGWLQNFATPPYTTPLRRSVLPPTRAQGSASAAHNQPASSGRSLHHGSQLLKPRQRPSCRVTGDGVGGPVPAAGPRRCHHGGDGPCQGVDMVRRGGGHGRRHRGSSRCSQRRRPGGTSRCPLSVPLKTHPRFPFTPLPSSPPLCSHMPIRRGSDGAIWLHRVGRNLAAQSPRSPAVLSTPAANSPGLAATLINTLSVTLTLLVSRRWRRRPERRRQRRWVRRASCPRRARATCW